LVNLIQGFHRFLKTNDSFRLVISGSKGWLSDEIYKLPADLKISGKVIFTGRISDQEARVLYGNASAFTYPSLYEGFGIPILEAFAANCPVITSNTSSMPEVAGDAAILVDPKSVPQIAAAMERILDRGVSSKLIKKGHIQLQKFSWSKAAAKTLKVLESL
jgi:glycosyltransferase involved in cell wall biosynthesis